jgi:broad specificity phosphatase PhoE
MKSTVATLLAALTAGCSLGADVPKTQPKTILVIRHAEKPADDADIDLSPEGRKRADALPDLFQKSATRPDPFPTPDFIFATRASKHSNRPVETVTPLAKKLNLVVNAKFADDAFPKLVEELYRNPQYDGKTVLICWHHGMIPELVGALGATGVPDKFKGSVFDQVWVVTFDQNGKAKPLVIRQQVLLPGDTREKRP